MSPLDTFVVWYIYLIKHSYIFECCKLRFLKLFLRFLLLDLLIFDLLCIYYYIYLSIMFVYQFQNGFWYIYVRMFMFFLVPVKLILYIVLPLYFWNHAIVYICNRKQGNIFASVYIAVLIYWLLLQVYFINWFIYIL